MIISADTIDDLMNEVLAHLLNQPFSVGASRGNTSEITGAYLRLTNPRARLSRSETRGKPFSALGELIWYLSGSEDVEQIAFYIKDYREEVEKGESIVRGAYGPRLTGVGDNCNQLENVISLLRNKPNTRNGVIQLFDAKDIDDRRKHVPCTCTLQFLNRNNSLHMITHMRSNDAYLGLPHDIFAFTMLQELVANSLGLELGEYVHLVGSLHLYEKHQSGAQRYLDEGFQPTTKAMPRMPIGEPWSSVRELISIESKIRLRETIDFQSIELDTYWLDIVRLLRMHALFVDGSFEEIQSLSNSTDTNYYTAYIDGRLARARAKKEQDA